MLVVLRVVAVRSNIGVFLNDPGPLSAGSIEKDAFTSLLCSGKIELAARAMRHRPRGSEARSAI
jgi:hypothetical protein